MRYVYDKFKVEIEDLLRRYNNKYKNSYLDKSILETKEEVTEIIEEMINQSEYNLIKELPIPPLMLILYIVLLILLWQQSLLMETV